MPDCEYQDSDYTGDAVFEEPSEPAGELPTAYLSGDLIPEKDWMNASRRAQLLAIAKGGIDALQELAGMAAETSGFHEDRPISGPELTNWQGNKLLLIVSEVVEAHDELRSGHTAYETYYAAKDGINYQVQEHDFDKTPLFKPEGVPSELADTIIRVADFAWTEGFDLSGIILEKLEFNATRPHKHGKAF